LSHRVLIVEDHKDTLRLYEMALSLDGFAVETAGCVSEALRLQPGAFDAVVTDLAMPEMSGLDLVDRLRRAGASMPIVVVTGQSRLEPVDGACALFLKPCEPGFLADQVRDLIARCPHDCGRCAVAHPAARPPGAFN